MIKNIVERPSGTPSAPSPPTVPSAPTPNGFPKALHRSQRPTPSVSSAFRKSRANPPPERQVEAPRVQSVPPAEGQLGGFGRGGDDTEDMMRSIARENDERIAGMSLEERESEAAELAERFGGGLLDVLRRRREKKEKETREQYQSPSSKGKEREASIEHPELAPLKSLLKSTLTKLPASSPQPPPSETDSVASSSLTRQSSVAFDKAPPLEEETPESIRQRYFPKDTDYDPSKLEWMQPTPASSSLPSSSASDIRYSLTGEPISSSQSASLPTHLGLHHHGDSPSSAGYTLAEVIHLCLSTVPSQRAGMLGVLASILRKSREKSTDGPKEVGLRGKALEVAGRAIEERSGGVMIVARGVEVMYEALMSGQDGELEEWTMEMEIVGDERQQKADNDEEDLLASLELESVIPILIGHISSQSVPPRTHHEILSILVLISRLPPSKSSLILVSNPERLLSVIARNLLSPAPDPTSLRLLLSLIISSRSSADTILSSSSSLLPALLKFLAAIPSDPASLALSSSPPLVLASLSLDILESLGRYGLSSYVCSDASDIFRSLGLVIAQSLSRLTSIACLPSFSLADLVRSYHRLLTIWTICATDPHKTTPEHEITWSQVVGMGWGEEAIESLETLAPLPDILETHAGRKLLSSSLSFARAWVEGCRVNEPRSGEGIKQSLREGLFRLESVIRLLKELPRHIEETLICSERSLKVGELARIYDAFLRLAKLVGHEELVATSQDTNDRLVNLLLRSDIWPRLDRSSSSLYLHTQPITSFLTTTLTLYPSPSTSPTWLRQALQTLSILMPGDEPHALQILSIFFSLDLTPSPSSSQQSLFSLPDLRPTLSSIAHRHGLAILEPFYLFLISPQEETVISPLFPSPPSLKTSTTLRLPSASTLPLLPPPSEHHKSTRGLPLAHNWYLNPLTELLHSSSSQAFASAPPAWDASETELVQASLAFAIMVENVSQQQRKHEATMTHDEKGRTRLGLSSSETIWEMMKVFLLEKGVVTSEADSAPTDTIEVFRDPSVETLMRSLLQPFLLSSSPSSSFSSSSSPVTLESAYKLDSPTSRTPFFQPYTDFLGLYTSISFSHPLFSFLLLPPLSQSYAPDYRRLFWSSENLHLLRGITTPPSEMLIEDRDVGLRAFLWPRERDGDVLGGCLKGLLPTSRAGGGLDRERNGFLYWLAVHHVAMAVWSEEEEEKEKSKGEEGGKAGGGGGGLPKALMLTVLAGGLDWLLRDIVLYSQEEEEGRVKMPETCFEGVGVKVDARVEKVRGWAGERGVERLKSVGVAGSG